MSQSRLALPVVAIGASALTFGSQTSDVDAATAAVDLQKVRKDIIDLIEADEKKRGDGTSFAGTFVRLAWHCAGTYAKVRGGGERDKWQSVVCCFCCPRVSRVAYNCLPFSILLLPSPPSHPLTPGR